MGNKRPKVVIAMAVQDTVKSKLCISLITALRNVNFDYDIVMRLGCDLIGSRTGLVRQAMKIEGATHLLFIDHDMFLHSVGNPKTGKTDISPITKLLSHDKDVIGVPYHFRSLPLKSTAIPLDAQPVNGKYEISPDDLPKELFKAQVLGTGFLLIKLSVFDKIAKPWFQFGRDSDAELVYGEDTFFVQQCIRAGIEVWCDPEVRVGHLGEYEY